MNMPSDSQKPEWDLVLRPKSGWFDLHLADLWRYRDLIQLFVWRDFASQFKQTILGPLWFIINPLITTVTFTIVFGGIAKLSTDGLPKFLFYQSGLTLWQYFSGCLSSTSGTFTANAGIFGKVYFPRLVSPISTVISGLGQLAIRYALFLGFLAYFMLSGSNVHPNLWILATPLLILLMAGMGLGAGIIISALTTKYRDLAQVVGFGTSLLMYATPIIYPLSQIPDRWKWLVLANPITPVIEAFRYAYLGAGSFQPVYLLYSIAATALLLFAGVLLFSHVEKTFMDTV